MGYEMAFYTIVIIKLIFIATINSIYNNISETARRQRTHQFVDRDV